MLKIKQLLESKSVMDPCISTANPNWFFLWSYAKEHVYIPSLQTEQETMPSVGCQNYQRGFVKHLWNLKCSSYLLD
jgi:hypothetical protein